MIEVEIKLLNDNAKAPKFAHKGDACADIRSNVSMTLAPGKLAMVPTGFAMAIPVGYEAQVRPRSGLAAKKGIGVLNSPGTIDSGYRGEVKVIMINLSEEEFTIEMGDRIAQMAIRGVPSVQFTTVHELSETSRGEGGFGSTGVK